jgi:hypothetical protein
MMDTSAGTCTTWLLPAGPLAFVEPLGPQLLLEVLERRLQR